jgi:hypothetical protein
VEHGKRLVLAIEESASISVIAVVVTKAQPVVWNFWKEA